MPTLQLPCPSCGDERVFETPPCADGHGADCAELACRDCGAALLVAPPSPAGSPAAYPPPLDVAA